MNKKTTKKEMGYIESLGICPKCKQQMKMIESRYIDIGSSYTFRCLEHGYYSLTYIVKPKDKTVDN